MTKTDQTKEQEVPADLLAKASKLPAASENLTEVNPFERPPLLKVGKDWMPGKTITGYFCENVTIPTPKSKYANEAVTHILRVGSPTGDKLGIWSVGELGAFFEGMPAGTLVSIEYVSKGKNADNNDQHFFKFRRSGVQ